MYSAKRVIPNLIHNMSATEGNPLSIEEVMALLEGNAVDGHKVSDQEQVLRLKSGWDELFQMVEEDRFELTKKTAIALNAIVAVSEALKVGAFRDERVGIQGVEYTPPHHGLLEDKFIEMVDEVNQRNRAIDRAVICFAHCARNQFFHDGNKRTAQLLMNGILLSGGQHAITIPAKERTDYFYVLREYYDTNNHRKLTRFLQNHQIDKIMDAKERS